MDAIRDQDTLSGILVLIEHVPLDERVKARYLDLIRKGMAGQDEIISCQEAFYLMEQMEMALKKIRSELLDSIQREKRKKFAVCQEEMDRLSNCMVLTPQEEEKLKSLKVQVAAISSQLS